MHAAVIAINEAVDKGQASVTMATLTNPNAMLRNTQEALAQDYQDTLSRAKARKEDQSSGRVRGLYTRTYRAPHGPSASGSGGILSFVIASGEN